MNVRLAGYLVAAALLCLSASACSSDEVVGAGVVGNPPVLDSIDAPDTVTEQNGQFLITVSLRYHDPDGFPVTKVRFRVASAGLDITQDIPNASATANGATVGIAIDGSAPKQTYQYTLNVIDSRGAESAPVTKEITLQ
ncbi:hypothetical protein AKJ09_05664 [Labilithrix luteola]|uniref:Lipoprotein n=1 Tax=Labilithrix luteola TaxID=1391654 RepID=A0A0K1PZN7_9BACT|nr:hypothetical protein [Labilithrix luteola]AKU99000.1 hypothetical protein AKJ09_05664 [Labilithrix luteola]